MERIVGEDGITRFAYRSGRMTVEEAEAPNRFGFCLTTPTVVDVVGMLLAKEGEPYDRQQILAEGDLVSSALSRSVGLLSCIGGVLEWTRVRPGPTGRYRRYRVVEPTKTLALLAEQIPAWERAVQARLRTNDLARVSDSLGVDTDEAFDFLLDEFWANRQEPGS
jgi:hypothetical protein